MLQHHVPWKWFYAEEITEDYLLRRKKNEIASRNGVQDMQYATIGQKLIFSFNKK